MFHWRGSPVKPAQHDCAPPGGMRAQLRDGLAAITLDAMNAAILLAAALATSDAPAPPLDASFDDVTQLIGTWEVVAATVDGEDATPRLRGERWIFAGDELKYPSGERYRIAASVTRLDRIYGDGRVDHGVYRIDGDNLVWTRELEVITFRRVRE
jgi:uncharacterized protein (TIGR03067 family)